MLDKLYVSPLNSIFAPEIIFWYSLTSWFSLILSGIIFGSKILNPFSIRLKKVSPNFLTKSSLNGDSIIALSNASLYSLNFGPTSSQISLNSEIFLSFISIEWRIDITVKLVSRLSLNLNDFWITLIASWAVFAFFNSSVNACICPIIFFSFGFTAFNSSNFIKTPIYLFNGINLIFSK